VYNTISVEEVSKLQVEEGVGGIIELRVWGAARAAQIDRLDLLTYFVEERGVRVNSFTKEEENFLVKYLSTEKRTDVLWHTVWRRLARQQPQYHQRRRFDWRMKRRHASWPRWKQRSKRQ
jgi:hypothetical protein